MKTFDQWNTYLLKLGEQGKIIITQSTDQTEKGVDRAVQQSIVAIKNKIKSNNQNFLDLKNLATNIVLTMEACIIYFGINREAEDFEVHQF